MKRNFVLSVSVIALVWAGVSIAEACSGCGCSVKKETDSASGACSMTKTEAHSHMESISSEKMKESVVSGKYVVLDARGDKYFNGELIPGAKRLTVNSSAEQIEKVLPNKEAAVITYCASTTCPASKRLAEKLKGLGYTHVQEYPEGLVGWKAAGNAVKTLK